MNTQPHYHFQNISPETVELLVSNYSFRQELNCLRQENNTLRQENDVLREENISMKRQLDSFEKQSSVSDNKKKSNKYDKKTSYVSVKPTVIDKPETPIDLNSIKVENPVKVASKKEETKESLGKKARDYADRLISIFKDGINENGKQNYFILKLFDESASPEERKRLYDFTTYVHYGPKCGDKSNQTVESHTMRDLSAYENFGIERGFITAQKEIYENYGYKLLDVSDHLVKYDKTNKISTDLFIVAAKMDYNRADWSKSLWHGLNKLPTSLVLKKQSTDEQTTEKPTYANALATEI